MAAAKKGPSSGGAGGGRAVRRLFVLAGFVGVAWFAIQGGEYSTLDLVGQRTKKAQLQDSVLKLQREVDSLAKWKRQILTDPEVQERIVREEFGMVRGNKELLYRFIDSTKR